MNNVQYTLMDIIDNEQSMFLLGRRKYEVGHLRDNFDDIMRSYKANYRQDIMEAIKKCLDNGEYKLAQSIAISSYVEWGKIKKKYFTDDIHSEILEDVGKFKDSTLEEDVDKTFKKYGVLPASYEKYSIEFALNKRNIELTASAVRASIMGRLKQLDFEEATSLLPRDKKGRAIRF